MAIFMEQVNIPTVSFINNLLERLSLCFSELVTKD